MQPAWRTPQKASQLPQGVAFTLSPDMAPRSGPNHQRLLRGITLSSFLTCHQARGCPCRAGERGQRLGWLACWDRVGGLAGTWSRQRLSLLLSTGKAVGRGPYTKEQSNSGQCLEVTHNSSDWIANPMFRGTSLAVGHGR